MANNQENLIGKGFDSRATEEQREIARQGGKASAEARRRKRDLRLALELLLEKEMKNTNGETVTGTEALTARLFKEAMSGNVRAFEVLRDTVGQKPVEKVIVADVDQEIIEEVERAVFNRG